MDSHASLQSDRSTVCHTEKTPELPDKTPRLNKGQTQQGEGFLKGQKPNSEARGGKNPKQPPPQSA